MSACWELSDVNGWKITEVRMFVCFDAHWCINGNITWFRSDHCFIRNPSGIHINSHFKWNNILKRAYIRNDNEQTTTMLPNNAHKALQLCSMLLIYIYVFKNDFLHFMFDQGPRASSMSFALASSVKYRKKIELTNEWNYHRSFMRFECECDVWCVSRLFGVLRQNLLIYLDVIMRCEVMPW